MTRTASLTAHFAWGLACALLACGGPRSTPGGRSSPAGRSSPVARATPLPTPTLDPARPLGIDDPAVPQIIEMLGSERPERRKAAAQALARVGVTSDAVPALVACSRAEDSRRGARLAAFLGVIARGILALVANGARSLRDETPAIVTFDAVVAIVVEAIVIVRSEADNVTSCS